MHFPDFSLISLNSLIWQTPCNKYHFSNLKTEYQKTEKIAMQKQLTISAYNYNNIYH